jgi:hypothetical protein
VAKRSAGAGRRNACRIAIAIVWPGRDATKGDPNPRSGDHRVEANWIGDHRDLLGLALRRRLAGRFLPVTVRRAYCC